MEILLLNVKADKKVLDVIIGEMDALFQVKAIDDYMFEVKEIKK